MPQQRGNRRPASPCPSRPAPEAHATGSAHFSSTMGAFSAATVMSASVKTPAISACWRPGFSICSRAGSRGSRSSGACSLPTCLVRTVQRLRQQILEQHGGMQTGLPAAPGCQPSVQALLCLQAAAAAQSLGVRAVSCHARCLAHRGSATSTCAWSPGVWRRPPLRRGRQPAGHTCGRAGGVCGGHGSLIVMPPQAWHCCACSLGSSRVSLGAAGPTSEYGTT